MLQTILSISGKPGLYKLVSSGKASLIVEAIDIETRKAVDLSYDAEAQDFITYLEKLRG